MKEFTKKVLSFLMIAECLMCLVACGSDKNVTSATDASVETVTEAESVETVTEAKEETNDKSTNGINPAFFSNEAIRKMFTEKGFPDYNVIYEEANNEAPQTEYDGNMVVMPADLTNAMIGKIGDKMTYLESSQNTYTLWDSDSIVSLYGEPYEYQGLFLLVNIYDKFEFPEGCKNLDEYFVSCNGDNVEFKEVLSDDMLITCYTFKYGYAVDLFCLVPDSTAMVAFKYEIPFVDNEEEIARLKEFGLPVITDYYKK